MIYNDLYLIIIVIEKIDNKEKKWKSYVKLSI